MLAGAVLAISGTVWCTVALPGVTLSAGLLLMLLEVVVVAALTNLFWAVTVALGAVLANWFLVPPTRTWLVASTEDLILLLVFVIAAVLSSLSVTAALRRTAAASRVLTEAAGLRETLAADRRSRSGRRPGTLALAAELDEVRLDDAGGLEVARWNRELGGEQAAEAAGRDDRRRQLISTWATAIGSSRPGRKWWVLIRGHCAHWRWPRCAHQAREPAQPGGTGRGGGPRRPCPIGVAGGGRA